MLFSVASIPQCLRAACLITYVINLGLEPFQFAIPVDEDHLGLRMPGTLWMSRESLSCATAGDSYRLVRLVGRGRD